MNLNFNKELSNFELMDLAHLFNIDLINVLMKDQVNNKLRNGSYIINLENHDESGSHWTALHKVGNTYYYFDPFGMPPPQTLIDLLKCNPNNFYFNDTQIQNVKSILCGYYCLVYLFIMQSSNNMVNNIKTFLQLFYLDTKKNDKELKKIVCNIIYNK